MGKTSEVRGFKKDLHLLEGHETSSSPIGRAGRGRSNASRIGAMPECSRVISDQLSAIRAAKSVNAPSSDEFHSSSCFRQKHSDDIH